MPEESSAESAQIPNHNLNKEEFGNNKEIQQRASRLEAEVRENIEKTKQDGQVRIGYTLEYPSYVKGQEGAARTISVPGDLTLDEHMAFVDQQMDPEMKDPGGWQEEIKQNKIRKAALERLGHSFHKDSPHGLIGDWKELHINGATSNWNIFSLQSPDKHFSNVFVTRVIRDHREGKHDSNLTEYILTSPNPEKLEERLRARFSQL